MGIELFPPWAFKATFLCVCTVCSGLAARPSRIESKRQSGAQRRVRGRNQSGVLDGQPSPKRLANGALRACPTNGAWRARSLALQRAPACGARTTWRARPLGTDAAAAGRSRPAAEQPPSVLKRAWYPLHTRARRLGGALCRAPI